VVFATGVTTSDGDLDPVLAPLGINTLALDVTSSSSIASAVQKVKDLGRLDIVINCAGIIQVQAFADMELDDLRRVLDVNVIGLWAVSRAFLPLLIESRGIIANIGSVNQVFCPPFMAAYNASKAAVETMGRTIRRELAPFGVRVVTLKTGSIRTGLFSNAKETRVPENSLYAPIRTYIETHAFLGTARWVSPEDYAKQVVHELLKQKVDAVLWKGGLATVAWLIGWLGWETMLVSLTATHDQYTD
jgi:NAD(P)-dependent dehydrogenase (short-subunit alcohol dehydrogenase family)